MRPARLLFILACSSLAFFAMPVTAYDRYTAMYTGISSYGRTGTYPTIMGAYYGVYAGGNYPHYAVGNGARIQYDQRYRMTTMGQSAYAYRTAYQNIYQYRQTYSTTDMPSRYFRDRRYPATHYYSPGTWSFESGGVRW